MIVAQPAPSLQQRAHGARCGEIEYASVLGIACKAPALSGQGSLFSVEFGRISFPVGSSCIRQRLAAYLQGFEISP